MRFCEGTCTGPPTIPHPFCRRVCSQEKLRSKSQRHLIRAVPWAKVMWTELSATQRMNSPKDRLSMSLLKTPSLLSLPSDKFFFFMFSLLLTSSGPGGLCVSLQDQGLGHKEEEPSTPILEHLTQHTGLASLTQINHNVFSISLHSY